MAEMVTEKAMGQERMKQKGCYEEREWKKCWVNRLVWVRFPH
jgi:hypothetical protein